MKYLLFKMLFLITIISFAQEPIYNRGSSDLLNYAYKPHKTTSIKLNNSFEFYNNDKINNHTNLYINTNLRYKIAVGFNAKYTYLSKCNNISGFDGIINYNIISTDSFNLYFAVNMGFINSNIDYIDLQTPYSFVTPINTELSFNSQNFNIGVSSFLKYKGQSIALSFNHLNTPNLPLTNDKIPIKYTAFIRNEFGRFSSVILYSYQNEFLFNPVDLDYYFKMLYYFGFDLKVNLGMFSLYGNYKYLSNYNDIYALGVNLQLNEIQIDYHFSILQDNIINKTAQFHQVGIYYYFSKNRRGRTINGGLRYL